MRSLNVLPWRAPTGTVHHAWPCVDQQQLPWEACQGRAQYRVTKSKWTFAQGQLSASSCCQHPACKRPAAPCDAGTPVSWLLPCLAQGSGFGSPGLSSMQGAMLVAHAGFPGLLQDVHGCAHTAEAQAKRDDAQCQPCHPWCRLQWMTLSGQATRQARTSGGGGCTCTWTRSSGRTRAQAPATTICRCAVALQQVSPVQQWI